MGVLKIDCFCDEVQMDKLTGYISEYLYNTDRLSIEDIDEEHDGVRICVEFDIFMDKVRLKNAEILNEEWDLLYEDSVVFTSRIRKILETYNEYNRNMRKQAIQIRNDKSNDI